MHDCACWRCLFFDRDEDDMEEGGYCRRYPPVPVGSDDEIASVYPGVEYLDWCGEFVSQEVAGS